MKVRRLLLAACTVAACCPLPVAHAAPTHTLTITGVRHGYAVLTVPQAATYDLDHATASYPGGAYAGFAIGRDSATLWETVDDVRRGYPLLHGESATDGTLRKGRVRVYLFADEGHETTVSIPWSGPDVTLRAGAPLDATVDLKRVAVPGTQPVAIAFPQFGNRRSNVDAALDLESVVAPDLRLRICLTRDATSCAHSLGGGTIAGSGTAVNGFGTGLSEYPVEYATKGTFIRGEVSGTAVGDLTLVVLRFAR